MDTMSSSYLSPDYLIFEQFREQHAALRHLLGQIGRLLAERTGGIEPVAVLLGQLGDQLVKLFAMEESDGYLGDALVQAPRLVRRANDLLHQHPRMEAAAKLLTSSLDSAEASRQWWDQTETRFKAFCQELLEHERNEDRLLQEAYSLDMEASD